MPLRLLKGHKSGPVFVTERKARVQLPASDLDETGRARLSYEQAEQLFKAASGGTTLHQLRHSALTHLAEDGMSAPMLMTKSGHTSITSLAKYARPSADALARWEAERDLPAGGSRKTSPTRANRSILTVSARAGGGGNMTAESAEHAAIPLAEFIHQLRPS